MVITKIRVGEGRKSLGGIKSRQSKKRRLKVLTCVADILLAFLFGIVIKVVACDGSCILTSLGVFICARHRKVVVVFQLHSEVQLRRRCKRVTQCRIVIFEVGALGCAPLHIEYTIYEHKVPAFAHITTNVTFVPFTRCILLATMCTFIDSRDYRSYF